MYLTHPYHSVLLCHAHKHDSRNASRWDARREAEGIEDAMKDGAFTTYAHAHRQLPIAAASAPSTVAAYRGHPPIFTPKHAATAYLSMASRLRAKGIAACAKKSTEPREGRGRGGGGDDVAIEWEGGNGAVRDGGASGGMASAEGGRVGVGWTEGGMGREVEGGERGGKLAVEEGVDVQNMFRTAPMTLLTLPLLTLLPLALLIDVDAVAGVVAAVRPPVPLLLLLPSAAAPPSAAV